LRIGGFSELGKPSDTWRTEVQCALCYPTLFYKYAVSGTTSANFKRDTEEGAVTTGFSSSQWFTAFEIPCENAPVWGKHKLLESPSRGLPGLERLVTRLVEPMITRKWHVM
jgi:hypothetical protein